jgi:arylsulfatase A-like enzyme
VNWEGFTLEDRDLKHIVAAYDAEIRGADDALARLVGVLEQRGLQDEILLMVTSDHGEEFGEHGMVGWHAMTLYEEMLAIPLVVRGPGFPAGLQVRETVQGIDIGPTLLAAAGLPVPEGFEGVTLQAAVGSGALERPLVAYGEIEAKPPFEAITLSDWKLFEDALYHLETDPGETRNLAGSLPHRVEALTALLSELAGQGTKAGASVELSRETLDELEALGYVANGAHTDG